MPCNSPLPAYKLANPAPGGKTVVFSPPRAPCSLLLVPCGKCKGCRLERSRQWAVRMMHEASLREANSFITLTYAPEHLPEGGTLVKSDVQKFIKRLRDRLDYPDLKFFCCGEYGSKLSRPHYHLIFFGYDFPDRKFWRFSKPEWGGKRMPVFRSEFLENCWPFGFSEIGTVTFESAAYVARYCLKKVNGPLADEHYKGKLAEFATMSNGIGLEWFKQFADSVFPHDYVVVNGRKAKPPRYYDKKFAEEFPGWFEDVKAAREKKAKAVGDDSAERLAVKQRVLDVRTRNLKRSFEDDASNL